MPSSFDKTFEFTNTDLFYRDAIEHAPIGILIFGNEYQIKFVNNNFFQFPGVVKVTSSSVIGKSIYEYRIFEDIDIRKDLNELQNGVVFEKELISSRTVSGNKISIIIKCVPILSENKFNGGIIVIEDVKHTSAESDIDLIHSNGFQDFLYLISDFFLFCDHDGTIKYSTVKNYDEYAFLFDVETTRINRIPQKLSGILFKKLFESVIKNNKTLSSEVPFLGNNKEKRLRITLIPVREDHNLSDTIIVLIKNVTDDSEEKIFADEEIKELRGYQQIVTNLLDGVIGLDTEGKIIFWNESSAKLFGLTRSQVYGKFIGKIFNQIDENFFNQLKLDLKERNHWEGELKIGEDDSIAEIFSVKVGELQTENEVRLIMLCTNITERSKLELKLKQSEERFRNIVTYSHEYICILDNVGRITYANPYFLEMFQYSEDEITSLNFSDLVDSIFLLNQNFDLNEIISYNTRSIELPLVTKSGRRVYVLASFAAATDTKGETQYYNVILTDITLKKESEKDLLLIRSLFEASHDGIALISKKRFVLVNDSFVQMFNYKSASEIIGRDPLDFIVEKDNLKVKNYIDAVDQGRDAPNRFDFVGRKKNNTTFDAEISSSTYETDEEKFIVWVLRDITEEKKSQEALQISEERYRNISENIYESFWTAERIDGELKAVFYTPAIKKITGYSSQDYLKDDKLWEKIIHPDDLDDTLEKVNNFYLDPARNFESFEYRIIDANGNMIWLENKINVKRDENGIVQKVYGIFSDITLSKRADVELKKSANELKELNEAKDRFISIISHDLRTPFSSILGFTDFLLTEKDLSEEKQEQYIKFIQESAKSMLSLVNSLLDWTRLQTGKIKFEPERISAKNIIERSIQILSGAAMQKNINITSELNKEFYIHADENLILQVFNNLISNAIKFTNKNGSITISANINIEKRQIEFSVADSGIGIKKEDLNKLFKVDTKFTTTGTDGEKGSGLGLSLVHDIIHKHRGEIWVESEMGRGTKFTFSIPIASMNLLLVDDVKTDRLLYAKLIKSIIPNYTILEAENGKQALEIIKQSSPALVITDHKMPVMSGYDLVKQLNITDLKYRPPVIILSSDINSTVESEYKELGVEYIFQKPVTLNIFKNAIEKSLRKAVFN